MKEIILSNNKLSIGILPEVGASLSFFTYKKESKNINILRPAKQSEKGIDAADTALFPIIPYPGRIRGGKFTYRGILRKVPKNHLGKKEPINGDGWKSKWTIKNQTDTSVTLTMNHKKEDGYPFPYTAVITYGIDDSKLNIWLTIKNSEKLELPCGLGVQPFFIKDKNVHLDFNTKMVWSNESDPIFDQPYQTPEPWKFSGGKPLKNAVFDTCFGGFDEKARITYPTEEISINITTDNNFHHVNLIAPRNKDFFCLSPVSCAVNTLNLAAEGVIGTGIRSLGEQQSLTGHISFDIEG